MLQESLANHQYKDTCLVASASAQVLLTIPLLPVTGRPAHHYQHRPCAGATQRVIANENSLGCKEIPSNTSAAWTNELMGVMIDRLIQGDALQRARLNAEGTVQNSAKTVTSWYGTTITRAQLQHTPVAIRLCFQQTQCCGARCRTGFVPPGLLHPTTQSKVQQTYGAIAAPQAV